MPVKSNMSYRSTKVDAGTLERKAVPIGKLPLMQCGLLTFKEEAQIQAKRVAMIEDCYKDTNVQRLAVLSYDQVTRLNEVMNEVVSIQGRGNFPTIEVSLKDLVTVVRSKLEEDCCGSSAVLKVGDIRLNGGAASYVLDTEESSQIYNDLDLIFAVELSGGRHFDRVKTAVLNSLLDLLPEGVSRKRISTCSLKEAYVSKMVKVNSEGDCWSLISLGNSRGHKNVELKFVDSMKRPFEFSVDSFQIMLDSLLLFYECSELPVSENFYPTVVGESVYGDFQEALYHLQKKLIATRNPEEIRGGGLLKYCHLLVRRYRPAFPEKIKMLERYMCSRFFIDFPDIGQQKCKLESYLWNHFIGAEEESLKYQYLLLLRNVVDDSTVCLMGHERRQTLALIDDLAYQQLMFAGHQKYLHSPPTAAAYLYSNGYYYTAAMMSSPSSSCSCNPYLLSCSTRPSGRFSSSSSSSSASSTSSRSSKGSRMSLSSTSSTLSAASTPDAAAKA